MFQRLVGACYLFLCEQGPHSGDETFVLMIGWHLLFPAITVTRANAINGGKVKMQLEIAYQTRFQVLMLWTPAVF